MEVIFDKSADSVRDTAGKVAEVVAKALHEDSIVILGNDGDYEFQFEKNSAYFGVSRVVTGYGLYSFSISLRCGGALVWANHYKEIPSLDKVYEELSSFYNSSFPNGYKWQKTVCEPHKIRRHDGTVVKKEPVRYVVGDIKSIRAIALKLDGVAIAFRFKTNVGTFDMRKEVAQSYGLGEFKADTFIQLKRVNGILMSDSEQRNNSFFTDVSDSPEDCEKLIKRLFQE